MTTDLDNAEKAFTDATLESDPLVREGLRLRGFIGLCRHLRADPADGKAERGEGVGSTNVVIANGTREDPRKCVAYHDGIMSENGIHCRNCGKQLRGPGAPVATNEVVVGEPEKPTKAELFAIYDSAPYDYRLSEVTPKYRALYDAGFRAGQQSRLDEREDGNGINLCPLTNEAVVTALYRLGTGRMRAIAVLLGWVAPEDARRIDERERYRQALEDIASHASPSLNGPHLARLAQKALDQAAKAGGK